MNSEASPAIAGSCIVGVLGAVIIMRCPPGDYDQAVIRWLIYAVTCGGIINYCQGLKEKLLLLYSIPSPSVLVAVVIYRVIFLKEASITGATISLTKPHTFWFLVVFWVVTVTAVWVFAHSRSFVVTCLQTIFNISQAKRTQVEKTMHWLVRIIGVSYLIINAILRK